MALCLIPAKRRSTELPDKNLRLLSGRPLLAWAILIARSARRVDRIMVSTESEEIAQVARQWNAEVLERPGYLAQDDTPLGEVVAHAFSALPDVDVFVLLKTTSPLLTGADVDRCLELFEEHHPSGVMAMTEVPPLYFHYAARLSAEGHIAWCQPMDVFKQQGPPRQQFKPADRVYRPAGLFVLSKTAFLKQPTLYSPEMMAVIVPSERAVDVHNEMDLAVAEYALRQTMKD